MTWVRTAFCCTALCLSLAFSIESMDEILLGGTYRMRLTTGDVLEGVVEVKNDSTLILESDGKPYQFRGALILEYTLLEPPKRLAAEPAEPASGAIIENEIITYDQLIYRGISAGHIEVRINHGSVFRGKVVDVNDQRVKLDVSGSIIPIAREVVDQIATYTPVQTKDAAVTKEEKPENKGPLDSVYIKSAETDEYGNPLAPVLIVGMLKQDNGPGVSIETPNGVVRSFKPDRVVRVIRNSSSSFEEQVQRYAKPLICPQDMALVDMPPGKPDKPFFKVCIDKFEYPNVKGQTPRGNVSYEEAQQACESAGKRLCTAEEWQWACSGVEGYTYPYGWHFEKNNCNTEGATRLEPAGNRHKCIGKFGLYDMVGNIFEWVTGDNGQPMLMGGPYSKCQTISPGVGGGAKPQTGFRCCKSN